MNYPLEELDPDEDDGTMVSNVATLSGHVVGHRIVAVDTALVLDNGKRVVLADSGDCCAYTSLNNIILNLDKIDHVITGVGTTEGYTKWHIYAALGDVVELEVGWSCGNPFYYGYGFDIAVLDEAEHPQDDE